MISRRGQNNNMILAEDVKLAINEMFMCSNMLEHMACYQHNYNKLKDWTFVVYSENEGTKLPDALCTNYDKKFAIINLGRGDRYYAIDCLDGFEALLKEIGSVEKIYELYYKTLLKSICCDLGQYKPRRIG